jgi:hypothetical protein
VRGTSKGIAVGLFGATMLVQSAWLLALPPFEGIDEIDHVYRAASVAEGNWLPTGELAPDGWGTLLSVPENIVEAAEPVCLSIKYYGPDNCEPEGSPDGDGNVRVASGAARYHPAFYWVTGTLASTFDGTAALYVMRAVAMTLSAALIAAAAWASSLWSRTAWPLIALFVALTPMVVYSNAVMAPNGVEMSAALAVWAALTGLARKGGTLSEERRLLIVAIPATIVLSTVRSLGPLWLALLILTLTALLGRTRLVSLAREHTRLLTIATVLVIGTVIASAWWIFGYHRQSTSFAGEPLARTTLAQQVPLWILQSIGVFPRRLDPAPPVTYVAELLILTMILALGYRAARRRLRLLSAGIGILTLALPMAITLTISQDGGWQGRYTLPFAFGLVVITGLALDESPPRNRFIPPLIVAGFLAITLAHVASVIALVSKEVRTNPLSGDSAWMFHDTWFVASLMVLGLLGWAYTAYRLTRWRTRPFGGVGGLALDHHIGAVQDLPSSSN